MNSCDENLALMDTMLFIYNCSKRLGLLCNLKNVSKTHISCKPDTTANELHEMNSGTELGSITSIQDLGSLIRYGYIKLNQITLSAAPCRCAKPHRGITGVEFDFNLAAAVLGSHQNRCNWAPWIWTLRL